MNNCVGAGNLKSFVLFLCYSWIGSALSLMIFGINYFFCADEGCKFSGVLVNLVRIMTVICVGGILFVSSMLANVTFGVMTGRSGVCVCVFVRVCAFWCASVREEVGTGGCSPRHRASSSQVVYYLCAHATSIVHRHLIYA